MTVPAGTTRTVPVVVPLAANGTVRLLASGTGAYVSLDVQAYYVADNGVVAAGRTRALTPARLYDSRVSMTAASTLSAGTTLTVPVLGHAGVPTTGVSAVVLNVLAYLPTTVRVAHRLPVRHHAAATRAVSYDSSGTVRTTVVAKVGSDGALQVYLPWGGAHVIIDVTGYVTG